MITRGQLDAILRTRAGKLQETPYPLLLIALAAAEKSAILALNRNQLHKEILFESGSPVDCRSNIATETFGRFLVAMGKVPEPDYHGAVSISISRGIPLEEVLTERKILSPTELYRMMQQSLGRKLLEPFSWKSGNYQISYDVPPVESALRVKVPQLIVTGVLKVEPQEAVDAALAGANYIALGSDPLFPLDDLRLNAEQQKIVEAARRGTAIADLASDEVRRLIYALHLLGIVAFTEEPVHTAPQFELDHPFRTPTIETPIPPMPVPHPVAAPPQPKTEDVIAAYLTYRRKDAFELLGVVETDGPLEFNRAFIRFAEKFHPFQFDERSADGVRDKAQEMFLAGARAYGELSDPDRRDALIKRRIQKRRQDAAPAPVPKVTAERPILGKESLIDPEALYRHGRELAAAGKLREALSSFEMAAECDAQNGTYAAEVAWCRFQLMSTPATAALKLLQNALRIDPRAGVAYLYAGKVLTALGNRVEAEAYLNRAAMLMPRDTRVAEALKGLR